MQGTALSHELSPQQHRGLPTKHVPEQTGKSCCFPPKSPIPVFPHQTHDSRPRVLVWLFTGEKEPEVWLAPVVYVKGILQQARKGAQWRRTKGEARFYPPQSQEASVPPLPKAGALLLVGARDAQVVEMNPGCSAILCSPPSTAPNRGTKDWKRRRQENCS